MQFSKVCLIAATLGVCGAFIPQNLVAQDEFVALAQVGGASSRVVDRGNGATMTLTLSQPVPYRIFTLTDPLRMVVDFAEVDWTGFNPIGFDQTTVVTAVRVGGFRPGWSRMVLDLAEPVAIEAAQMLRTDEGATLHLSLDPVTEDRFAQTSGVPETAQFALAGDRVELGPVARTPIGTGPLRIVLDPGHGGIDPGAERDGQRESDLMLSFAQELRDVLVRAGGFDVVLTRNDDTFVPLETRISIARAVAADVFLSLHADAISEGQADGATVYTLADRASDEASLKLAERHDRADLLAGIDLSDQDDVIAAVLLDMARTETKPRTNRLADALVSRLQKTIEMHTRPRMEAGFSVLKSADVPSVLLEVGFLSSPKDRANLIDPVWRQKAAQAIRDALSTWVDEEREIAQMTRQ
ncbi:N-acetylmuramoyl-L-alanine amidase [Pacificibacter marinus]|uniref:N-acetylmuramoyl-L-alanine amidase n=1 Tax=Pacificibacter marinus TaxID=658057 RepID=A0A1Y5RSF6_9RHOB|nr:N-acetylmuramoyl-L-alanine amidase [Pacificibacter marinus]SEK42264.1 N-acetylmuramoyl-L-alanine amidase [Pacificibacter marinus]SLN24396.1 N-acetylmuramoyl-L-alanine amidase AmiA precursor [Pacificibacter marinus]